MSNLAPIKLDEKKLLGFRNVPNSKGTDAEKNTDISPLEMMDRAFNKVGGEMPRPAGREPSF